MNSSFEEVGFSVLNEKPPFWLLKAPSGRSYYLKSTGNLSGRDLVNYTLKEIEDKYESNS